MPKPNISEKERAMVEKIEDAYRLLFSASGTDLANGEIFLVKNESGTFVSVQVLDDVSIAIGQESLRMAIQGDTTASDALAKAAVLVKAAAAVALDRSLLDM